MEETSATYFALNEIFSDKLPSGSNWMAGIKFEKYRLIDIFI